MQVAAQQIIVVVTVTGSLGQRRDQLGSRLQGRPADPLEDHLTQLAIGDGSIKDHRARGGSEQGLALRR